MDQASSLENQVDWGEDDDLGLILTQDLTSQAASISTGIRSGQVGREEEEGHQQQEQQQQQQLQNQQQSVQVLSSGRDTPEGGTIELLRLVDQILLPVGHKQSSDMGGHKAQESGQQQQTATDTADDNNVYKDGAHKDQQQHEDQEQPNQSRSIQMWAEYHGEAGINNQNWVNVGGLVNHGQACLNNMDQVIKSGDPTFDLWTRNGALARMSLLGDGSCKKRIRMCLGNFSCWKGLGQGRFGKVWKAVFENSEEVAVKQMQAVPENSMNHWKERDIMCLLRHKRICNLIGAFMENDVFLVMELCLGSLRCFNLRITENQTFVRFAIQIAEGLQWIHSKRIIHCDIRLENILVTATNNVVITDFGSAVLLKEEHFSVQALDYLGIGGYQDFEANSAKMYSFSNDMFAFCCTIFEVETKAKLLMYDRDDVSFDEYARAFKEGRIEGLGVNNIEDGMKRTLLSERVKLAKILGGILGNLVLEREDRWTATQILESQELKQLIVATNLKSEEIDNDNRYQIAELPNIAHYEEFELVDKNERPANDILVRSAAFCGFYYDVKDDPRPLEPKPNRTLGQHRIKSIAKFLIQTGQGKRFLKGVATNDDKHLHEMTYLINEMMWNIRGGAVGGDAANENKLGACEDAPLPVSTERVVTAERLVSVSEINGDLSKEKTDAAAVLKDIVGVMSHQGEHQELVGGVFPHLPSSANGSPQRNKQTQRTSPAPRSSPDSNEKIHTPTTISQVSISFLGPKSRRPNPKHAIAESNPVCGSSNPAVKVVSLSELIKKFGRSLNPLPYVALELLPAMDKKIPPPTNSTQSPPTLVTKKDRKHLNVQFSKEDVLPKKAEKKYPSSAFKHSIKTLRIGNEDVHKFIDDYLQSQKLNLPEKQQRSRKTDTPTKSKKHAKTDAVPSKRVHGGGSSGGAKKDKKKREKDCSEKLTTPRKKSDNDNKKTTPISDTRDVGVISGVNKEDGIKKRHVTKIGQSFTEPPVKKKKTNSSSRDTVAGEKGKKKKRDFKRRVGEEKIPRRNSGKGESSHDEEEAKSSQRVCKKISTDKEPTDKVEEWKCRYCEYKSTNYEITKGHQRMCRDNPKNKPENPNGKVGNR